MKRHSAGHWRGVLACLLAGTVLLTLPQWASGQSASQTTESSGVAASAPNAKSALLGAKKKKKKSARSAKANKSKQSTRMEQAPPKQVENVATPRDSVVKTIIGEQVSQLAQLAPAAGFSDVMGWFKGEEEITPSTIPVDPKESLENSPTVSSFEEPPAKAASQQPISTPPPVIAQPDASSPPPIAALPPLPPVTNAQASAAPGEPMLVRDPVDVTMPAPVSSQEEKLDSSKQNALFKDAVMVPEKKPEPVFLDLPSGLKAPEAQVAPAPAPALPPMVSATSTPAAEEQKKAVQAKATAPEAVKLAPATTLALPPSASMLPVAPPALVEEPKMVPPVNVTSDAPLPTVTPSAPVSLVPLPPIMDPMPVPPPSLSQVPLAEPVPPAALQKMEPQPLPAEPVQAQAVAPVSNPEPVKAQAAADSDEPIGDQVLDFFSRNLGLSEDKPKPPEPTAPPVASPVAVAPSPVPPSAVSVAEPIPAAPSATLAMPPVVDDSKAAPVTPVATSQQPFSAPDNAQAKPAEAPAGLTLPLPLPPQTATSPASDAKKKQTASEESPALENQAEKNPPLQEGPGKPFIKRKKEKIRNIGSENSKVVEEKTITETSPLVSPVPLVTALDADQPLPLPENEPVAKPVKKKKGKGKDTTPPPRLIEEVIPSPAMGAPMGTLGESQPALDRDLISPESRRILSKIPSGLDRDKDVKGRKLKMDHSREIGDLFPDDDKEDSVHARGIDIKVKRPDTDVDSNLENAYDAVMAGRSEQAVALYEEVLAYEPSNKAALLGLATTYQRAGELKRARPLYGRLIELDPQNRQAISNFLGLLSEEDPQEALFQLEKLEDVNPNFSPIPAQMAMINQKLGNLEESKKQMIRATVLSPENMTYRYNLAVLLDRMNDWKGASKLYQQIISASERGEKIPAPRQEIQERLTFIMSNIPK